MRVHVKFFAILRDKAGASSVDLELSADAKVSDAIQLLEANYPSLTPFISKAAFAVNREYQSRETPLRDGDELALIPPVSGG